jgi:hypothetical protein
MGQYGMTLHDAICEVLTTRGAPMTPKEIANELALRKLYRRKNGTLVPPQQVSTRINRHPELFVKEVRTIALKCWRQ